MVATTDVWVVCSHFVVGGDFGDSRANRYVAARAISAHTDGRYAFPAIGNNGTALNDDIATIHIITTADACTRTIALGLKTTFTFNGYGLSAEDTNARIFRGKAFYVVCARQQDGGITLTADACPLVFIVVVVFGAVDGHITKHHGSPISNRDLDIAAKGSCQHFACLSNKVAGQCGEVDSWARSHFYECQLIGVVRLTA